jgi:ribonucleotide reductase beta subunit family protein with ferritin-like domain
MSPLTEETRNRFVVFPVHHDDVWKMYKKAQASFWTAEEMDLSKDVDDWNQLTDNERHFLKYVLAFFAASDGIVNENLAQRFSREVVMPEARAFYTFQQAIETVHNEAYSLLIDTYISDTAEKAVLFDAIRTVPCIGKKADWALKWISDTKASFAQRLLAFACVEGIFFSGSFCAIYWFKERGILKGLGFSNELISRDESLHTEFAILLYTKYVDEADKLKHEDVHAMVMEAIEIEAEFITEAIPCEMIGMSNAQMIQYIKFCANRLLTQLGYDKIWNVKNPFQFMERMNMEGRTNFFEGKPSEYSIANVERGEFDINADF